MDASSIVGLLLCFVPLLVVIVCVAFYVLWRGRVERSTLHSSLMSLSANEYTVLANPGLRSAEGVVGVDYAIVSVYGIFFIIASEFRGRVNGAEEDDEWELCGRFRTSRTANPLKTIGAFTEALYEALPSYSFRQPMAVVAYPSRCILNVKATQHVTHLSKVMDIIGSYDTPVLSRSETAGLAAALQHADVNHNSDATVLSDMM